MNNYFLFESATHMNINICSPFIIYLILFFHLFLYCRVFTLYPGDVILTGTPSGVGMHRNPPEYLKKGDILETEIEGIGRLKNIVA